MSQSHDGKSPTEVIVGAGLQKFDLKLFLTTSHDRDAVSDRLLAVFSRWRGEEGEEIIDLQDYAHVPDGPGIVLVSKRWVLSVDWAAGRPGVLLSTRRRLQGSHDERFAQALQLLLEKAQRLLAEPEMQGAAQPNCGELQVTINDRVLFSGADEAESQLRGALESILDRVYGRGGFSMSRCDDAGGRLAYLVRAGSSDGLSVGGLLEKLNA